MLKVIMGTPCHRRLDLLKLQADYHKNVLRPFLLTQNIDLIFFLVGTDHLEKEALPIDDGIFIYESQPENLVTRKFNRLVAFAKERKADVLMTMGSDDLIPPKLFLDMIAIALENAFISAPSQMHLYDIPSKNVYVWRGYSFYNSSRLLGLGSGRVYTRKLLEMLPEYPFGDDLPNANGRGESAIDPKIYNVMKAIGVDLRQLKTSCENTHNAVLLSLKYGNTSFNPVSIFLDRNLVETYTLDLQDRSTFDWLPDEFLQKITDLKLV